MGGFYMISLFLLPMPVDGGFSQASFLDNYHLSPVDPLVLSSFFHSFFRSLFSNILFHFEEHYSFFHQITIFFFHIFFPLPCRTPLLIRLEGNVRFYGLPLVRVQDDSFQDVCFTGESFCRWFGGG